MDVQFTIIILAVRGRSHQKLWRINSATAGAIDGNRLDVVSYLSDRILEATGRLDLYTH